MVTSPAQEPSQRWLCRSFIELDLPLLIDSAFAAGAAMISFGAVLGKVTPAQIVWLLVLQVPIYAFNAHLVTEVSPCTNAHMNVLQRLEGPWEVLPLFTQWCSSNGCL